MKVHGLKGKKKSPEHLVKIRANAERRRGVPLPAEVAAKVSAALKGKRPKNLESLWEKLRGRKLTEEHKAKLRAAKAAHRGRATSAGTVHCTQRATVYGLASSRDGRIRYVGQTVKAMETRFREHLHGANSGRANHLYNWMRQELSSGFQIVRFVIERNAEYNEAEQRWIAWYRRHGASLVNMTDGGRGNVGYVVSDATRALQRAAKLGKKVQLSEAEKQRRIAQILAVTARLDVRAKIASALRGKKKSAEAIAKRTATRRARGSYGLVISHVA